ncbi:MAG: hypothetical protein ACRCYJ_10445, partial [Plesiomonas shigelloides]
PQQNAFLPVLVATPIAVLVVLAIVTFLFLNCPASYLGFLLWIAGRMLCYVALMHSLTATTMFTKLTACRDVILCSGIAVFFIQ